MLRVNPMLILCESCPSEFEIDSKLVKPKGTLVRCSKCRSVFKVYPSDFVNWSRHPSVKTQNLLSYFSYDEDTKITSHGLGIALEISRSGLLLETPCSIESGLIVLTATDKTKNFIKTKGRLIYSKKSSSGRYLYGIKFIGKHERIKNFIINLVKAYNAQKNNIFITLKK